MGKNNRDSRLTPQPTHNVYDVTVPKVKAKPTFRYAQFGSADKPRTPNELLYDVAVPMGDNFVYCRQWMQDKKAQYDLIEAQCGSEMRAIRIEIQQAQADLLELNELLQRLINRSLEPEHKERLQELFGTPFPRVAAVYAKVESITDGLKQLDARAKPVMQVAEPIFDTVLPEYVIGIKYADGSEEVIEAADVPNYPYPVKQVLAEQINAVSELKADELDPLVPASNDG